MRASPFTAVLVLALSLSPVSARSAALSPLPLSRALRAVSLPTIPAAWAGIWSATDTARDCVGPSVSVAGTMLDTLCTGMAFGPDTTQFQCSGTFSDTDFDITCTGHVDFDPTCSVTFNEHLQGTRSGDTVRTTTTFETIYTPTLCA